MRARTPTRHDAAVPLTHEPKDAAARLGVGVTTLYRMIAAGQLRVIKIGRRTLVPESELVRFVAEAVG